MSTDEYYIEYERGSENVGQGQIMVPITHRTDIEIAWEMYNEGEINETIWTQYFNHYEWNIETNDNWCETPQEPITEQLTPCVDTLTPTLEKNDQPK